MAIFSDKFEQLKKADRPVKAPKYIQDIMGIRKISVNGIFEVQNGSYTKTYRFTDINYVTAGTEDSR